MKRYLLDVNVFLAMLWPRHEGHAAAQGWFAKTGRRAWATSPLTQLGTLRLLTNPVVTQGAVSPAAALGAVREATQHDGHEFWPLGEGMPEGLKGFSSHLRGYRQWTDAALLWQATERDGVLVSFDSGIRELVGSGFGSRILLLKRE